MARTTTFKTEAGDVKLSAKGIAALDALCKARGNVTLAVAYLKQHTPDAALCERQVRRVKRLPQVRALMIQRARDTIIDHVPAAADKMASLMDSPSQKTQYEAARRVLDIANIRPPDAPAPQVNVGVRVGMFITDSTPAAEIEDHEKYLAGGGRYAGYVIDLREPERIEHKQAEAGRSDA